MEAGRSLDVAVAEQVMGFAVSPKGDDWVEQRPEGSRPVRPYSTDIGAAWEVVEKLGVTLLPVEHGSWFALAGPRREWKSPDELIECLQKRDFSNAGAGVSESAPHAICLAGLAMAQRRAEQAGDVIPFPERPITH